MAARCCTGPPLSMLFPCFPSHPTRGLSGSTAWSAAALPSAPAMPCARAVGTWCPLLGLAPSQDGASRLQLVERLGKGARPHLHHVHPMATVEPVQRHDRGWHLCIFSFCCIALRAGNKACGQPATRRQQPVLCTPPVGTAAAGEGGSAAC